VYFFPQYIILYVRGIW